MSKENPLGLITEYKKKYNPNLVYGIPRITNRNKIPITTIPKYGSDIINIYELSSLSSHGTPWNSCGILEVPHISPNIIESKSLKLYLNSFNNSNFDHDHFEKTVQKDLSEVAGVEVKFKLIEAPGFFTFQEPLYFDELTTNCQVKPYNPNLLQFESNNLVHERLFTDKMRSNCPVTGQPHWATISIEYTGFQICRRALLEYLLSFRNKQDSHETCVETIYEDIKIMLLPDSLTVYGQFLRRGGIEINPYRSSEFPTRYLHISRTMRQ